MLTHKILTSKDVDEAVRYYDDGADDYYAKDAASQWQGRGAEALGLRGEVDRQRFREILLGQIEPEKPSVRAAARSDSKERIGIDLTFSAPKSVSIQGIVGDDARVIAAHDRAVQRTLQAIEELAQARRKVHGKTRVERTKNLIIASFRHETSREFDPQLHTHAVVANLTRRGDGAWRALKNDEIIKTTRVYGAVYRAELAAELQQLGYTLRYDPGGNFELTNISRSQLEAFSRRSSQVESRLAEMGLSRETATTAQKQMATLKSRAPKVAVERAVLFSEWCRRAHELGIDLDHSQRIESVLERRDAPPVPEGTTRLFQSSQGDDSSKWSTTKPDETPDTGQLKYVDLPEEEAEKYRLAKGADRFDLPREVAATAQLFPVVMDGAQPAVAAAAAEAAARSLRYAVAHLSERQAVIEEAALLKVALEHATGRARYENIRREIDRRVEQGFLIRETPRYRPAHDNLAIPLTRTELIATLESKGLSKDAAIEHVATSIQRRSLVETARRYTTKKALERERRILQLEHEGRGQVTPVGSTGALQQRLAATDLDSGQRRAAELIATTTNRIVGIQGFAGTGKSHMLRAVKATLVDNGFQMQVVAPNAAQVKNLRGLGVEARTLASFIVTKNRHVDAKTILVVDEAGSVATRQLDQTLKIAKEAGARVVLVGDVAQTDAIEAGRPFAQLQAAGMETARMEEIRRQTEAIHRGAVELAATGYPRASLEHLQTVAKVTEIKDPEQRRAAIASDYAQLPLRDRERTLIVTDTNESRRELNHAVRMSLGLEGKGSEFDTLFRRDMTRAQRSVARNYRVGDLLQPEKNYPKCGLQQGELYRVVSNGPENTLTVRTATGEEIQFSPAVHRQLSVYEQSRIELAAGDLVRITRNDAKRDLANGDRFRVEFVTPGKLELTDGKRRVVFDTDKPLHLDHAYATTVHSAQGLTSNRVLYDARAKSFATRRDSYYVAISRARRGVQIYTDSRAALPAAISRKSTRLAALDLERDPSPRVPAAEAPRESVRGRTQSEAMTPVEFAIHHLTERQAVVDRTELMEIALKYAVGNARVESIEEELKHLVEKGYLIQDSPRYRPAGENDALPKTRGALVADLEGKGMKVEDARQYVDTAIRKGTLVEVEPRYTTQTALENEKRVRQIEHDGRGKVDPILPLQAVRDRLASTSLDPGQRSAAELIATTSNRVVGVHGYAGTGKSHMLHTAQAVVEEQGYRLQTVAPYAAQVRVLRQLGVESRTLASFIATHDKQIDAKTVLVVDEAGTVPTRLLEQTLQIAEKARARVVLVGDLGQTRAIEAGKPFAQLQDSGMETARMEELHRPKTAEQRRAIEQAARGDTAASLISVRVTEIADDEERHAAIARDFTSLAPAERQRTIIVAGTNEARLEINKAVRFNLGLEGRGQEFNALSRIDTTRAQRLFSKHYAAGDVIQPDRDYPKRGLTKGETYRIIDNGPGNRLTVEGKHGERIQFCPMTHRKLSVYSPERLELTPGDLVRFTRNDASRDLANGDRFTVKAVSSEKVTLHDGRRQVELRTDRPLHLDYAYASTVHGAQGVTTDRVLYDAHSRSSTTTKDVYYVAISRARYEAHVYTDDRDKLPDAISRDSPKHAALDLDRYNTKDRRAGEQRTTTPVVAFVPKQVERDLASGR